MFINNSGKKTSMSLMNTKQKIIGKLDIIDHFLSGIVY